MSRDPVLSQATTRAPLPAFVARSAQRVLPIHRLGRLPSESPHWRDTVVDPRQRNEDASEHRGHPTR